MLAKNTMLLLAVVSLIGCKPLDEPRDVEGNFTVEYVDNLRVYIGGELVAEAASGEDATVTWDGETFQISTLCSDEGVECPSENYWQVVAVAQPWGEEYRLLNFVNIDQEHGIAGARMGGLLDDDGSFAMLSGLALLGNGNCAALGVGTVTGMFSEDATGISDGVIAFEWAAGCTIGDVAIGTTLRLETDYTATRTGDYDVSSVEVAAPIDEDGETVDPDAPDDDYSTGE